jgi:hypothetical protein
MLLRRDISTIHIIDSVLVPAGVLELLGGE